MVLDADLSALTRRISGRVAKAIENAAPARASSGEWIQTIVQAGHSSCQGGFVDRDGDAVLHDDLSAYDQLYEAFQEAVEELHHASGQQWNVAKIAWHEGEALANIQTTFDAGIVPRPPNDPVYEQAAAVRRQFWEGIGRVAEYIEEAPNVNVYGQTRWLSSHRRLILICSRDQWVIATDGLSTPWPGVSDKVNGFGVEVYLEVPKRRDERGAGMWNQILLVLGDMIADEGDVAGVVTENAAVLFCELPREFHPYSHMVLSVPEEGEPSAINSLPFGSARLLKATPVTRDDLADASMDGWATQAANQALQRRRSTRV